ncbi:dynamin family protein [Melaminivora suipulveris]|uniref:Dynamin family protein n=1 Tax=Melaminivora suipulveris TaxID=2109913 RepID=A0A2R3QE91_9BURK|nr:dynamin family protein [Melaminivora suipulveris]AVO50098.1 dynamin family protein [Melaminivora suipulveris]
MLPSFNEQFDQHGAWRRDFARQLGQLGQWLQTHDLMDAALQERLQHLHEQVRRDKVMVAFVAEFSRGKSELINAVFFAGYGRRIMPASAGRTTMCPTELGYEGGTPASLRLLPIETRMQSLGLAEWRLRSDRWVEVPLDMQDAAQLAGALERVSQVRRVPVDEARALGFWQEGGGDDNPVPDAQGLVEVPMWRHALINIPHPLLAQGLVILDTPGLNAVGAEPELTINLIPQAHAVVFILGADTGVTRSDLAIWREHLGEPAAAQDARLVVLNKIDTLWDTLSSPSQVQAQLERQCRTSAEMLGVPLSRVVPVSAQKGLVAKIQCDDVLLEASGLPALEEALAEGIIGRRQAILRATVAANMQALQSQAQRTLNVRRRDLDDQALELRSLRGKNASVIDTMRARIEQEQREFDASAARIQAVRAVQLKMLRELFRQLGARSLKAELEPLGAALTPAGLKLGVRKVYVDTFARARAILQGAQATGIEIQAMLAGSFRQLNAEHGFSLQVPPAPELGAFVRDLVDVERRHLQYVGMGNTLRLAQPEFTQRLLRALSLRLRTVFEGAANELEQWSKGATAQLDVQLRERKHSFARRIEAVARIQSAAESLSSRIAEIEDGERHLAGLQAQLDALTAALVHLPADAPGAAEALDIDLSELAAQQPA